MGADEQFGPDPEPAAEPDRAPLRGWLARLPMARLQELAVLLTAAIAAHEAAARLGTGLSLSMVEDEADLVLAISAPPLPQRCPECQGSDCDDEGGCRYG